MGTAPTYDEIRGLTGQLRKENRVKIRRDLGKKIHDKLKDEDLLRKLAKEATPESTNWPDEDSVVAKRCRAMSFLWTSVIQTAIYQAEATLDAKKIKLVEHDVLLPYNLLLAAAKSSELIEEDASVAIPYLSKKTVRSLLKYCLKLLAIDKVTGVAGVKLVEMLSFMCSKEEFVGAFKYPLDFANILDELSIHLTQDIDGCAHGLHYQAAKAMDNLFATARSMGIQMNVFIHETINFISGWCKSSLEGPQKTSRPQTPAVAHMFNTVTSIIYAHPDHSIGPMRRFGKPILRYCRKCYPNVKSPYKEAFNFYLLAHLFLSQFAGKIQGRVAGHMGDLGEASLVPELLQQLLDMVMNDAPQFLVNKAVMSGQSQRKLPSWAALDFRQRQHLELAARLLACAQHEFLCVEQWKTVDKPSEALLSSLKIKGVEEDEWIEQDILGPSECPWDVMSDSPWHRHVLGPLVAEADFSRLAQNRAASGIEQNLDGCTSVNKDIEFGFKEMLSALGKLKGCEDKRKGLIFYLSVVGACAELFPAGQCWTSNIFDGSKSLVPFNPLSDNILLCRSCSVQDFALLVYLLAALLDEHGGPAADSHLQMWILASLIKLTEPSALFYRQHIYNQNELSCLAECWQLVWKTLFRVDLRYNSSTKYASKATLGELVMVLLKSIIQYRCTDPSLWSFHSLSDRQSSFLYTSQSQLWALPIFKSAKEIPSSLLFEVICWMSHIIGLSNQGKDQIDNESLRLVVEDSGINTTGSERSTTRRWRLICFALATIEFHLQKQGLQDYDIVSTATSAIVTLIRGKVPRRWELDQIDTKFSTSERGFISAKEIRFTTLRELPKLFPKRDSWLDSCIENLWCYEDFHPSQIESSKTQDIVSDMLLLYRRSAEIEDSRNLCTQVLVSESDMAEMLNFVLSVAEARFLPTKSVQYDITQMNEDVNDQNQNILGNRPLQQYMTLAFKVVLSFHMLDGNKIIENAGGCDEFFVTVVQHLRDSIAGLSRITREESFRQECCFLAQIGRCLLGAQSVKTLSLPSEAVESMFSSCKLLLDSYAGRLSKRGQAQSTSSSVQKNEEIFKDDLMDDDGEIVDSESRMYRTSQSRPIGMVDFDVDLSSGDESQSESRRKRKRSTSLLPNGEKKSRRQDLGLAAIPDDYSATKIAELLLILRPSSSTCELVCRALLGAEIDVDPVDLRGDINLRMASACVKLVTMDEVLLHRQVLQSISTDDVNSEPGDESAISILYKVLDMIRVASDSKYYMYGYEESALVHRIRITDSFLSEHDTKLLVSIMQYEDGIGNRPHARSSRMRAATTGFREGGERFHQEFDKHFSGIIKLYMVDSCFMVRRNAYSGVNAALLLLDEQRALHSINKLIAPIFHLEKGKQMTKEFADWFTQMASASVQDEEMVSGNHVKDAFEVMEKESIFCKGVIAASVAEHQTFLSFLFEIIMIPTKRPDLELVCLQALQVVAIVRKYGSIKAMFELELPGLLFHWVRGCYEVFPLILTAPDILQRIAECTNARGFIGPDVDLMELREEASLNFVSRNRCLLVPLSLLESIEMLPSSLKTDDRNGAATTFLAANRKLRAICTLSFDREMNEENLQKAIVILLRKHVVDIRAFCLPMLQSGESTCNTKATKAYQLLCSIISTRDVEIRTKKKAHILILRIIELFGLAKTLTGVIPSTNLPYVDAISAVLDECVPSTEQRGDKMIYVGANRVMNLIKLFARLDKALLPFHKHSGWSSISLQSQLIMEQGGNEEQKMTEIGFCIQMFTEALLKIKLSVLRPTILKSIEDLLTKAVTDLDSAKWKTEAPKLITRLVGACFHVHETCQQDLLHHWKKTTEDLQVHVRRSCGLCGLSGGILKSDVWGWDEFNGSQAFGGISMESLISDGTRETIKSTFQVLSLVFTHSTILSLDSRTFVSIAPPHTIDAKDLELLRRTDEMFCAQSLALQHIEKPDLKWQDIRPPIGLLSEELKLMLENRQAWMILSDSCHQGCLPPSFGKKLNLDQRLIFSVLTQLEHGLKDWTVEDLDGENITPMESMIRNLTLVCTSSCPKALQVAASRCLGQIKPALLLSLYSSEELVVPYDWMSNWPKDGGFLSFIQEKCFEALSTCLRSPHPTVSQVASETLATLLTVESSRQVVRGIKKATVRAQLWSFTGIAAVKESRDGDGAGVLSQRELIRLKARVDVSDNEGKVWCWDETVWMSHLRKNLSFEEWICTVTPAIIICCFEHNKDDLINDDGIFFWRCQKICSVEHNIAASLFPYVVLSALATCERTENKEIAHLISRAFENLLIRAQKMNWENETASKRVLTLLIDTLDIFRRISQRDFLSRKHSRNVLKIKARKASPKSQDRSVSHNSAIPITPQWDGVPYGIMLQINGLVVAKACFQVRRYASALFFLELYLNSRYGEVGGLFEKFPRRSRSHEYQPVASDISGKKGSTLVAPGMVADQTSILEAMTMMADCYKEMGESEAMHAVQTLSSAVRFDDFGCDGREPRPMQGQPIHTLRAMNTLSDLSSSEQAHLIATSMQQLECHKALQSYVANTLANTSMLQSLNERELHNLRETWFESSLKNLQWELLGAESDTQLSQSQTDARIIRHTGTVSEQGYFRALAGAFDCYRVNDEDALPSHLFQGRTAVVTEMSRIGGEESSLFGMIGFLDRLRALQIVENLFEREFDAVEKVLLMPAGGRMHESVVSIMAECFGSTPDSRESVGLEHITANTTRWVTELGINTVLTKRRARGGSNVQLLFETLVSQFCSTSVQARKFGDPDVALEAVKRLHRLLESQGQFQIGCEDPTDQIVLLRLQESKILECRGDFKGAIRISGQVVDHLIQRENTDGCLDHNMQRLLVDSQLACGAWLTKYKVQQASSVLEAYLQPGAERARKMNDSHNNTDDGNRTARASLAIGKLASELHKALLSRTASNEWRQSSSTKHLESELFRCEPILQEAAQKKNKAKGTKEFPVHLKKWEEIYVYCDNLRKDLRRTEAERNNVMASVRDYLKLALESYIRALSIASTGMDNDLSQHVFELMSLWFASHKDTNVGEAGVNEYMKGAVHKIPSYRFVPLTNQLFSRIEKSFDRRECDFQTVLHDLVFQMCANHPYHCILPLLALSNGKKVGSGVSGRHASAYIENVGNSKVAPANAIISRLRQEASPYVVGLLHSYSLLADSYIHLAGADTASFHKKTTKDISFAKVYGSNNVELHKCLGRGVEYPPAVFTAPPTLQPGASYGEGIEDPVGGERVRGFTAVFSITETGLHRPKIVKCLGTRGGVYKQLVKGEDEIRQDAIMAQVFDVVNNLMRRNVLAGQSKNKATAAAFFQKLRMITYNVVPLSPASGVLEWVENTAAFGEVVVGKGSRSKDVGMHARYYPNEWNFLLCRKHLAESPTEEKRQTYDEICRRFSPCFRFFFVEKFGHDMMAWHAAKMRYIRSVAVSSMVGHILGIGDRHTSNILVHTKSAEIVQIDFGIVFEQGKLLHTPERVPFRLTRNMIDGMGPCGTEGTFVHSAEETMRVLRKNASTLLTILSAVVEDPLYKWSVSPVEGMRRQKLDNPEENDDNGDDDGGEDIDSKRPSEIDSSRSHKVSFNGSGELKEDQNEMGQKTIAKINDKLQGYEESTSGEQQGVEGQVQLLINSAQDADNLALMYPGWSPFV